MTMKGPASLACVLLAFASLAAGRPDAPVAILGGTNLELTDVTSPNVVIPVWFVETDGGDATLAVTVSPFVGPGGPIEPKALPSAIQLKPYGEAMLTLEASLLNAGKYRAAVHAVATAGQKTTALDDLVISITRTRSTPPFEVADVPAIQVEIGWFFTPVGAAFDLQVNGVDNAVVPAPLLLNATRKPKADSAAGTITTVILDAGTELSVTAGQAKPMRVSLANITSAGRYDATLRFAAPGYQPVDRTVTAFVREPWHHALLLILAGVLVSLGLHVYTNAVKPRLLTQQRVTAWREQLDAARKAAKGDPDALALVDGVSKQIGVQWDKARQLRVPLAPATEVYEAIVPAVPQWIAIHRQLLDVRPVAVRDKLMPKLTAVFRTFVGPTPDAAVVKTAVDTVAGLPDELAIAIGETLKDEVMKLERQIAADQRLSVTDLRNLLELVRQKIDNKEYEAALDSFGAVRLKYAAILGDDLLARTNQHARPTIFTQDEWNRLRQETTAAVQELRSKSDADEAMNIAVIACKNYLRQFMAALNRAAEGFDADVRSRVVALKTEMETALTNEELTTAWRKVEAAQTEIDAAMKKKTGSPMGGLAAAAGAATAFITDVDPLAAFDLPPSWAQLARHTAARTARAVTRWDILTSAIVLVAAGAVGIQTLWVDNATWGGGAAYLAAFLWGFAADQFTHAGVTALGKK
jgi:hypothetical protein